MLPSSFRTFLLPDSTIVRRQRSLPSVPTHNSTSDPSSVAEVRKIESFHTQGVAPACPGKGSRQATLVRLPHSMGRFFSVEMPLLPGPRHWGQFSAWREAADPQRTANPQPIKIAYNPRRIPDALFSECRWDSAGLKNRGRVNLAR